MQLELTGQNLKVTPSIRSLVNQKFTKLDRHMHRMIRAHLVFSVEKNMHQINASIHMPGHDVFASSTSDDMYKTIDDVIAKLDKLLIKTKEKDFDA